MFTNFLVFFGLKLLQSTRESPIQRGDGRCIKRSSGKESNKKRYQHYCSVASAQGQGRTEIRMAKMVLYSENNNNTKKLNYKTMTRMNKFGFKKTVRKKYQTSDRFCFIFIFTNWGKFK